MLTDIVFVIKTPNLEGKELNALRNDLKALAKPGRRLILDLSGVEKVNSMAASMIVGIAGRLSQGGGCLKLVGAQKSVAAFFELLRVQRSVEMYSTQADVAWVPLAA